MKLNYQISLNKSAMKALLCSPSSSIFLHNSPPNDRKIRLISPTSFPIPHPPQNPPRDLQANAKGFSGGGNPKQSAANKNLIQNAGKEEEEEVPTVVFQRIITRILVAVGVPLGIGLASLKLYGEAKEEGLDLPLWVPFTTVLVTFSASTLGVAYGALSSSWDPERSGSVFGFEEAKENWVDVWREENND